MSPRRGFGDGGRGFGDDGRGFGDDRRGFGDRPGFGDDGRGFGDGPGFGDDGLGDGYDGPVDLVDDETIDALLDGEPIDPRFDYLAAFAEEARALGDRPSPQPSPALAHLLARGGTATRPTAAAPEQALGPAVDSTLIAAPAADPVALLAQNAGRRVARGDARGGEPAAASAHDPASLPARRRRWSRTSGAVVRVASLGLVAKVALAASVGTAGVAAAGAAGVLPDPATRQVRHAIEITTPFAFSDPADDATEDEPAVTGDSGDGTQDDSPGAGSSPAAGPGDLEDGEGNPTGRGGRDDTDDPDQDPAGSPGRSAERPTPDTARPDDRGATGDAGQPGNAGGGKPDEPGNGQPGNVPGKGAKDPKPSDDKGAGKPE